MKSQSIKSFAGQIIKQVGEIGAIFIIVQYVEKELLLHLSKIENVSYEDAKKFVSENHFEFMIGKFNKLTDKRFGKEFNKDLEKLRILRNFLVHDFVFVFFDQQKDFSETSKDINKVFWKFILIAEKVLPQI